MSKPIRKRTPRQVLNLWIRALRGQTPGKKYLQAQGQLVNEITDLGKNDGKQGMCCLGVLCDLARRDGGKGWFDENTATSKQYARFDANKTISTNAGSPPLEMSRYIGLTDNTIGRLQRMNDSEGKSFDDIAAWLKLNKQALLDQAERGSGR